MKRTMCTVLYVLLLVGVGAIAAWSSSYNAAFCVLGCILEIVLLFVGIFLLFRFTETENDYKFEDTNSRIRRRIR